MTRIYGETEPLPLEYLEKLRRGLTANEAGEGLGFTALVDVGVVRKSITRGSEPIREKNSFGEDPRIIEARKRRTANLKI